MAAYVRFIRHTNQRDVWINPELVIFVTEHSIDIATSVIHFSAGESDAIRVVGTSEDVVSALMQHADNR